MIARYQVAQACNAPASTPARNRNAPSGCALRAAQASVRACRFRAELRSLERPVDHHGAIRGASL